MILAVAALLAGSLTPTLLRVHRRQKLLRARRDTCALRDAVQALLNDVGTDGIVQDASRPLGDQQPVELAVGDGDIPRLGPDGSPEWVRTVNLQEVDFLAYHVATNRPGNEPSGAYPGWRGAYIEAPVDPDPWGNRYMVNAQYLASGTAYNAVVLSAGPDEEVDSAWAQSGFTAGDDDIFCTVTTAQPVTCELTVCNDTHPHKLVVHQNGSALTPQVTRNDCHTWDLYREDRIRVETFKGELVEEFTLGACPTTRTY